MPPWDRSGLRTRFERRLVARVEGRPDGAIATWRWMWRALKRRSSSPGRLWMRFALHVTWDAVLLLGWYMPRIPTGLLSGSRSRLAAMAVALLLFGVGLWVHQLPHRARWPVAKIDVAADGTLRVQGQVMSLDGLQFVADRHRIGVAQVTVAPDAAVRLVRDVNDALTNGRTRRVRFMVPEAERGQRRWR